MDTAPPSPSQMPRRALWALAALALGALVAATSVRLSGTTIRVPDAAAVVVRELRFEDRPDGSIAVTDPRNDRSLAPVTGENGFVRGTLRGLMRERKRLGIGREQPFELVGRADGRLTLIDPATDRRVDLESFGPVNSSAFARWLNDDGNAKP